MENLIAHTVGVLGGSGIAVVLARYFITKALENLDECSRKITEINEKVTVMASKFELFDEVRKVVGEHDREIAALKVKRK